MSDRDREVARLGDIILNLVELIAEIDTMAAERRAHEDEAAPSVEAAARIAARRGGS